MSTLTVRESTEAVVDVADTFEDYTVHALTWTHRDGHVRVVVTVTELGEYPPHTAREIMAETVAVRVADEVDRRDVARVAREVVADARAQHVDRTRKLGDDAPFGHGIARLLADKYAPQVVAMALDRRTI